jgi:hypothetical protein
MSSLATVARTSLRRAGSARVAALAQRHAVVAVLVTVVLAGAWLRLDGGDWDEGAHLHPDERYVTMVADSVHWPGLLGGYFNVETSPLSPYNTETGKGYVYGTLPLYGTKAVGALLGRGGYQLNIVGRRVSALLDAATIVLVFLTALLVLGELGRRLARVGALVAAALYAFTVTAIQDSHYFTADSWLVFFGLLTFYLVARSIRPAGARGSPRVSLSLVAIGASLGLAVACKVSGAFLAIPVGIALLGRAALAVRWAGASEAIVRFCLSSLTVTLSAYVAFRSVSPYAFAHSNWLDLSVHPDFRAALDTQRQAVAGAFLYPPSYQWLLSPRIWDPLENLVVWQLGIPLGLVALGGVGVLVARIGRWVVSLGQRGAVGDRAVGPERLEAVTLHSMLVAFVLVVFFWTASSFAHTGRYLLPIVPFLCVAAAYGLVTLTGSRRPALHAAAAFTVAATGLYALSFEHVYRTRNTRIAASDWIAAHVPPGSTIVNEHWDDPLPVGGRAAAYKESLLPVFDPDDGDKLRKLYTGLSGADVYILSSPRAWRTIGRLPDRFPLMTRFYEELFAGRLGFAEAASFSSGPALAGITLNDIGAEEAFWVYDHPPVRIFRRTTQLSFAAFKDELCPAAGRTVCA